MREHDIYIMIADYLRYQYPTVIYRFDLAADLKLTMGQASKHKILQRYRGYPDLFIAEPYIPKASCRELTEEERKEVEEKLGGLDGIACAKFLHSYYGLFIELKREGTRIFKKDGTLVSDSHIREQYDMLEQLRKRGYAAEFAIGFEGAKKLIDDYMKGRYAHID